MGYKLPNDIKKWNQEILKHFFEENDWIEADNYYLRWSANFDADRGYGTGVVVLAKGDKQVAVPIVVRSYELDPMDVFYRDEKFYPLTRHTLSQAFHSINVGDQLVDPNKIISTDNTSKNIFPPHWGRYTYASADPDILEERLCDVLDIDKEDLDRLREQVKTAAASFFGNDVAIKFIHSILTKEIKPQEKVAEISDLVVSPEGNVGYKLQYTEDGAYKEKITSYKGAYDFIKQAFKYSKDQIDKFIIDKVDKGDTVTVGCEKVASITETDLKNTPASIITTDAKIVTFTTDGTPVEGYLIPRTYSFDFNRLTRDKILVDKDKNILAEGEQVVGRKTGAVNIHAILNNTRIKPIRPGLVVSFVWRNEGPSGSLLAATKPAKVISVTQIAGVGTCYELKTEFGNRTNVLIMKNNERPVFSKENKYRAIYLPAKTVVVTAENEIKPLVSSNEEFQKHMVKSASAYFVEYSRVTNEIVIQGPGLNKVASIDEARYELIRRGISVDNAEATIKLAMRLGYARVYADKVMKKEAASEEDLSGLAEEARKIRDKYDLVKIAAEIEDPDTLDKVLALNFISKRNIRTFVKVLPAFKEAVHNLAHLLVASRLGKFGFDQESISDAMFALQELVEKMEGLKP